MTIVHRARRRMFVLAAALGCLLTFATVSARAPSALLSVVPSWGGWPYLSAARDTAQQKIIVIPNGDGRLHAFRIGLDGQIWHNDQRVTGYGASWTGWNYLSVAGDKAKAIGVIRDDAGLLHATMIGLDDQVWRNDQSATTLGAAWSGWQYFSVAGDKAQRHPCTERGRPAARVHDRTRQPDLGQRPGADWVTRLREALRPGGRSPGRSSSAELREPKPRGPSARLFGFR